MTSWDEEARYKVRHEPLGAGRVMGAVAVVILAFGIGIAVIVHRAIEQERAARQAEARWQATQQGGWAGVDAGNE